MLVGNKMFVCLFNWIFIFVNLWKYLNEFVWNNCNVKVIIRFWNKRVIKVDLFVLKLLDVLDILCFFVGSWDLVY